MNELKLSFVQIFSAILPEKMHHLMESFQLCKYVILSIEQPALPSLCSISSAFFGLLENILWKTP
jgi:hypothetical protein